MEKEETTFKCFSKKGLMVLAMAGVMMATPFMLSSCSKWQDGVNGTPGTIWEWGTNYTEFTDAKVGDYFIDINDSHKPYGAKIRLAL